MPPFPSVAILSVLLIAGAYLLGSISGARVLRWVMDRSGWMAAWASEPGDESPPSRGEERPPFLMARSAFDLLKGTLAVWLVLRHAPVGDALSVTAHGYLAAGAVVIGHLWPVWHRFRGGGGTPPLAGALVLLWPVAAAIWLVVGMLVWLRSGHAGLSVVLGALCVPLLAWWAGAEPPRLWFAWGAPLLLALGHRESLGGLWSGTEPRFARVRRLYRWRRKE